MWCSIDKQPKRYNNMRTYIIFFICISCLFSCTHKKESTPAEIKTQKDTLQVIDLSNVLYENSSAKLSDFVESISYISLSDDKLIGDISQLYYTDNKFFIRCGTAIQIFASDGSYLKPLFKEGNGPGEAICLERFTCNEEQNIIFYQYERKIMKRVLPLRLDQAASAGFAS